jgi:RNA polymerase sigma factor (sigma-70 family)
MTEVTRLLEAAHRGDRQALDRLAAAHPEKAELVKLRYFAGLSADQVAAVLNISPSTADRHWAYARAWLRRSMSES